MKKKNILLICDLFPPAFGPRMGYLCKYLKGTEWQATVFTEQINDQTFSFLEGNCPVTYVNFYDARFSFMQRIQWLWTFLSGRKERKMYKEISKRIEGQSFDLVLCSTYRTFPLTVAARLAKEKGLPLVADLRDIIEQYTGTEFISHALPSLGGLEKIIANSFKKKSLECRNRVLKEAACITTVSPWHVETLKSYNPNTHLIYNGFDPELFKAERYKTPQFIITYTGRLLSTAMRDPSLLLQALAWLQKKGKLSANDCRVQWYVDPQSKAIIEAEAAKAGVSHFMDYKGYVPASQVPDILNHSSILLLLTNRSTGDGPKGVMTTKFFESLAIEKPILCVRSDEGCLAEALKESNAGLAACTVEETARFIEEYYQEWKEKGYTTSAIDKNVLRNYSRQGQAQQFIHIFDTVIKD